MPPSEYFDVLEPADLGTEIAHLARAGFSVTITPRPTPYGVMSCDVLVAPRAPEIQTRTAAQEIDSVANGARPSRTLRLQYNLALPPQVFANDLRDVRLTLLESS